MYYILPIDSYSGTTTSREQFQWSSRTKLKSAQVMFAVIQTGSDGAHIVDDGYRSVGEAKDAWPEAK